MHNLNGVQYQQAFAELAFTEPTVIQTRRQGMHIGIIGSGSIGATVGKLWAHARHTIMFSSRHPEQLAELVAAVGHDARAGTIQEAAQFGEVILLSVPWLGNW